MTRHEFLRFLHSLAAPRTYLEIGVNTGKSLTLSRVPSIGVDPAYRLKVPIEADVQLVKETSDDFFARSDPLAHFRKSGNPLSRLLRGRSPFGGSSDGASVVDLAFIDGLHLFEFALRDFMNVERHVAWTSVIVFDDVLPRDVDEAARDRHTKMWAGDVYKVGLVLREHRPDLVVLPMNTAPTGLLVVLGADPTNEALRSAYDGLLERWVTPDPQVVPTEILRRERAVDPQRFVDSNLLPLLVRHREAGTSRTDGIAALREAAAALTG
jgi:hypothetical protein